MNNNDIVLINKIERLIKLYTGGYDNLRGVELINDDLYIAFGYLGMGSTFRIIRVNWNDFINLHEHDFYKTKKIEEVKFSMNSKRYFGSYIEILIDKINKQYQHNSNKNLTCKSFEDLKFFNELEIILI